MPTFIYEAMDSQGREVKAEIEAASEKEAGEKIRALNFFPTKVFMKGVPAAGATAPTATRPKPAGFAFGFGVGSKLLCQFTRQFATLMDAGLPIVRTLEILQHQTRAGLLKDALLEVKEDVEGGSALSEAFGKHPRIFDKLYVNMIKAGEAGGILPEILLKLAEYMEKSQRLKQKIIGALVYPVAVVTIAAGILSLIMIFIIPRFEQMFHEMGMGAMPLPTQILMGVANTIADYWYILIFTPLFAWGAVHYIGKTPKGRYTIDLIKLKFPIFGSIVSKSAVSRFCRTLGTLLQSGVPILSALAIIKNATGNAVVAGAVDRVHNSIREGDTIAEPLKHSGVFDELVVNMIAVGEETGELDKMLIKVADTYDGQVDLLVGALMSLLEPVLIIGMGITVGFIVISLFLPLIIFMQNLTT
ncbi:MAG: type II secretion system F family protein [Planctomycetes bacterium]|nr:type II secretion system F family protein [Planctomycetota bacterium]